MGKWLSKPNLWVATGLVWITMAIPGVLLQALETPTQNQANQAERFIGFWVNEKGAGGPTSLDIRVENEQPLVEEWGACFPRDCHWNEATRYFEAPTIKTEVSQGVLSVQWNFSFVETSQQLTVLPDGRLQVKTHDKFKDSRAPREDTAFFVRSHWSREEILAAPKRQAHLLGFGGTPDVSSFSPTNHQWRAYLEQVIAKAKPGYLGEQWRTWSIPNKYNNVQEWIDAGATKAKLEEQEDWAALLGWPELKPLQGRKYWAIFYLPPNEQQPHNQSVYGADLWVFVDQDTLEVITYVVGRPRVSVPSVTMAIP